MKTLFQWSFLTLGLALVLELLIGTGGPWHFPQPEKLLPEIPGSR